MSTSPFARLALAALVLGLNAVAYGSFFKRSRVSPTRIP